MFRVLCFIAILQNCQAFNLLAANRCCRIATAVRAAFDEDEEPGDDSGIPQLPAIGESSFGTKPQARFVSHQQPLADGEKRAVAFVSDKFELQYTCKVCETRNAHRVSRIGNLSCLLDI